MSAMKKYAPPYDIAVILKEVCKLFIIRDDSIKIRILTEEWGDDDTGPVPVYNMTDAL